MMRLFSQIALAVLFGGGLIWLVVATDASKTNDIVGNARIVDGDSLEIDGNRIRIVGIDAPELSQTCGNASVTWRCGQDARTALSEHIGKKSVHCVSEGKDKYRRSLAVCKVDGDDIGKWMITHGWAVSYGKYKFDEAIARRNRFGLWKGEFELPKDWRKKSELGSEQMNPITWVLNTLGM